MDSMKVLLGVTFALLLVALGFAYTQNTPNSQSTVLQRIDSLETDNEKLREKVIKLEAKLEVYMPLTGRFPTRYEDQLQAAKQKDQALANEQERLKIEEDRLALVEKKRERQAREREAALQAEEMAMLARERELNKQPERRIRERLKGSNAIGQIKAWNSAYGLAEISVVGDPGLKSGDILAIRRAGTAIGQLEVKSVQIDGIMAQVYPPYKPGIEVPDFKVGDEAIFAP